MYERVRSIDARHATVAKTLAARLPAAAPLEWHRRPGCKSKRAAALPRLRRGYSAQTSRGAAAAATWIFRGDESRRRRGTERGYAAAATRTVRGDGVGRRYAKGETPHLSPAHRIALQPNRNAGDHLDESRSPEMLTLREASEMARAGFRLLRQAFDIGDPQYIRGVLENFQGLPPTEYASLKFDEAHLKAGAQLVVDSFLEDEKSHVMESEDLAVMSIAMPCIASLHAGEANGTGNDAPANESLVPFFCWIVHHHIAKLNPAAKPLTIEPRDNVIHMLEASDSPFEDRILAFLYFIRSLDKLEAGDLAGSFRDLDLAVAKGGARYQNNRITARLQTGDLSGARDDAAAVLAVAHDDDRRMPGTLFMMAAFLGKEGGRDDEGRAHFKRAVAAAARGRYLFGTPPPNTRIGRSNPCNPNDLSTPVGFFTNVAYQRYGTPEERAAHLKAGGLSYGDLQQGLSALVGIPRAQAQAFLFELAFDDAPPTRSKGDVVVVHGLTSDTGRAHNGALAIVAGPATNGRFAIELVHARKTISARPQNLRAASDAEASAARDMAGRRPIAEMAAAAPRSSRADDVKMYERVRSIDARHAKVAKTLAEGLSAAPPLVWYAEGDTPGLCPANIVAMLPHGNAGHHLDESRSPEMLTQREAAEMARAGVRLLRQAFHDMNATLAKHQAAPARLAALQNFHISQPNVRVDMCVLKAGAQLLVDSFFADEKSHGFTPEDMKVMYISGSYFCDDKELQEHFAFFLSNLLFEWIVYRGLAKVDAKMKQVADKVLDNVIRTLEAPACPLKEDRVLAYVYFARSFERTRTGDIAGGVRDLDLACAKGGARFQRSRIPVRLQAGDLDGATADMEAVVDADAHDDDRHLKDTLFMMAAFRGKESRDEEGRTYFQWAVRCAARHRYLFGEPSARRANPYNPKGSATVVGFITNVAYQRYGTPEQRAAHLKSGGLSYGDLQTGLSALVGMPRAQAQAFLGRPAADDAPPTRSKGDVVVVHGLTSDAGRAHNGALAIVAGSAKNGRYALRRPGLEQ